MRKVCLALLAGLLVMIGTPAGASDFANGFYVGGNGGLADNLSVCDEIGNPVSPSSCDDSDFGWQVFAGWQIVKWIGIEGGWTDLGQSSFMSAAGELTQVDTGGFQVNAVATVPLLEKAGVYFKAGAFVWDVDVAQTDVLNVQQEISEKGVDYVLGIGLRYPLTETLGVGIEYQRFEDVGDSKTGTFDANLLTAGLLFRF